MSKTVFRKLADSGAGPITLIVTGIGFFSDFAKPFFNFIPFFLIASLLATGLWWYFAVKKAGQKAISFDQMLETVNGKILGMLLISTIYWLILTPVFLLSPDQGFAATASESVSDWQEQLFGKLDRIENKIDRGFADVIAKIDQVDKSAGLIQNPSSPNEFYHNAKIQELNGNLLEARRNYEQFIDANLTFLDPYLSYANILKNLEGPSSAKEILAQIRSKQPENPAANLVYAINKDSAEDKLALLQTAIKNFPDYGPNYYYLVMQYSFQENGLATNEEKKTQREAIQKFMDLEAKQGFSKYLIDKEKATEMVKEIEGQSKMTEGILGAFIDKPIDIKITPVNKSVSIAFLPTELVQKIFYRINQKGDFKETGDSGITMAGQSSSLPNYQVMEALPLGEHVIEVKYNDTKGKTSPVYTFPIKIEAVTLNYPPYKMINPENGQPQYLVSWSFYDSNADYEVKYSLDNEKLDQTVDSVLYLQNPTPGKHTLYLQAQNSETGEKTNIAKMEFTVQ